MIGLISVPPPVADDGPNLITAIARIVCKSYVTNPSGHVNIHYPNCWQTVLEWPNRNHPIVPSDVSDVSGRVGTLVVALFARDQATLKCC